MRSFTDEEAAAIREAVHDGPRGTAKALAEELGVPRSTISRIARSLRRPEGGPGRGRPAESWGREPTWAAQFADRIEVRDDGCWDFRGAVNQAGYGLVSVEGRQMGAHRASYALHHGTHPRDLGGYVMHSCDRPICVNPAHLSTGTHRANMLDRDQKTRFFSKLTVEQVLEIRDRCPGGRVPYGIGPDLVKEYGVTLATIRRVIQRRSWTHV